MTSGEGAFRPDIPSTARMYDYYLGGKDNYPADREAADRVIGLLPAGVVRAGAAQNRKFLGRAVRHLTAALGIRQFLDIGTGLPTLSNVHEVAQSIAPGSRVVYVDHDPIVVAHGRDLLHGSDRTAIIERDLRDPASILADPSLRALLDFGQPIAVLLVAILPYIRDDEDPYGVVDFLMSAVPVGSYLVISHFTADSDPRADVAALEYAKATSSVHTRTRAQVAKFFAGLELIDPGEVVWAPQWHPDADDTDPGLAAEPGKSMSWCGVARKTRPGPAAALPAPAAATAPARTRPGRRSPGLMASSASAAGAHSARFSPEVPNVARMYDYMLGGKDNYPADREAALRTFDAVTEEVVRGTVLQNRKFLGRAVRHLAADLGIRQFLDIGTGLPSMNNVHEVAHSAAAGARVVYVDNDPVVVAHARDMLNGVPDTTIVNHDLRDPASILRDGDVRSMLDAGRPVAVLLVAILHFISDAEDPGGIVSVLMDAVPAGSCLVISHGSADHFTDADKVARVYEDASSGMYLRSRAAVRALFGGLPLVNPGELVWAAQWHPDAGTPPVDSPGGATILCGIARKA
jgi:hypothetical protein